MKDHARRVLSALFLIPPVLLLVKYGSAFHFYLLQSLAMVLGFAELYRLLETRGLQPLKVWGTLAGLGLSLLLFLGGGGRELGLTLALFVIGTLILFLVSKGDIERAITGVASTLFGVLYLGLLLSFPAILRSMEEGQTYIFYLFLVTWTGDTGAYYTGTLFGYHRLAPPISPRKSIEGSLGGLAASLLTSLLAKVWFWPAISLRDSLALGLFLGVMGQAGDLAESLLKRSLQVKDSGSLIPGHGGVLDRLDSLLFTAPAMFSYLVLRGL